MARRGSRNAAKRLQIEQRRAQVALLRREGQSFADIAKQLSVPLHTVTSDLAAIHREYEGIRAELVEGERKLALERLDVAIAGVWKRVKEGNLQAIATLLKIEARRSKLLGLDAPERQEISGRDGQAIQVQIDARQSLLSKLEQVGARQVVDTTSEEEATEELQPQPSPEPASLPLEARFNDLLSRHDKIIIAGGPGVGKSTLADKVTDRHVIRTDYYSVELGLPWHEVPPAVVEEARKFDRFVIEGVRGLSVLREGLSVDAVLWMSIPKMPLSKRQETMRQGRETVLRKMLREGFLDDVETVFECTALAPSKAASKRLPASVSPNEKPSLQI